MLPSPSLFGFTLSWYWLLLSAAIIISLALFLFLERRHPSGGQLWQKLAIVYSMIIIGFIFGRLFSLAEQYLGLGYFPSAAVFLGEFKTWPGSRWYGALTAGFLFLESVRYIFRPAGIDWPTYFSNIATAVCLGIAIGKIGCFLDGHLGCGGIQTSLPWGVYYPYGAAASQVPLHPVQLYDSVAYGLLYAILMYLRKKGSGEIYRMFFLGAAIYNIPAELVVSNTVLLKGHMSLGQYVYIFLGTVALVSLLWKFYRKRHVWVE